MSRVFKTYYSQISIRCPFLFSPFYRIDQSVRKIQRKFTKSVFFTKFRGDYASCLPLLDLDPTELLFIKSGLLYIYKFLHPDSQQPSILPPLISSSTRNSSLKFIAPLCKSEFRSSLLPSKFIVIWNSLPFLFTCTSLTSFRQGRDSFYFLPYLNGRISKTL